MAMGAVTRWNTLRVALFGALVGLVFTLGRILVATPSAPPAYWVGGALGGLLADAILFAVVSWVRNHVVGARRGHPSLR